MSNIDICDWSAPECIPPNPAPFEPRLAGMVYRLRDVNYFRYDEEGQAQLLMSTPFGANDAIAEAGDYHPFQAADDVLFSLYD